GSKTTFNSHFALSQVAPGTATLAVVARGVTNLAGQGPQHHLTAALNGHPVVDLKFSGDTTQTATAQVQSVWLKSGRNTLAFVLPGDVKNQYNVDILDIKSYSLAYPRLPAARQGVFSGSLPAAARVTVAGLRPSSTAERSERGRRGRRLSRFLPCGCRCRLHRRRPVRPALTLFLYIGA